MPIKLGLVFTQDHRKCY